MNIKNIIGIIVVAVIFAVGGYFTGQGSFGNGQGASVFKSQLPIPRDGITVIETEGCWTNGDGDTYLYHKGTRIAGPCPKATIHNTNNTPASLIDPNISEANCPKDRRTYATDMHYTYVGCYMNTVKPTGTLNKTQ